jgi:hypothetical protein
MELMKWLCVAVAVGCLWLNFWAQKRSNGKK